MRTTLSFPILLAAALSACGDTPAPSEAKNAGYDAFQDGDYSAAVSHFDTALEGKDAGAEDYVEVHVERCRALAHVDGPQAEKAFKELLEDVPDPSRVTPRDFSLVASELITAKQGVSAVQVVDAGMKRFPDDEKMKQLLEKVKEAAQKDPAMSSALQGLGYLGGD